MKNQKIKCPEYRDTNIEILENEDITVCGNCHLERTNTEEEYDPHYDKVFRCHDSIITRRELEELPVPFCTKDVTDDQMETIIIQTDAGTRQRLKLPFNSPINGGNSRHNEVWWEELEEAVNTQDVPYWEDLPDESEE